MICRIAFSWDVSNCDAPLHVSTSKGSTEPFIPLGMTCGQVLDVVVARMEKVGITARRLGYDLIEVDAENVVVHCDWWYVAVVTVVQP